MLFAFYLCFAMITIWHFIIYLTHHLTFQIFGSIGSVGGGLALGKEGPLVHTGACIASLLGQVSAIFKLSDVKWMSLMPLILCT